MVCSRALMNNLIRTNYLKIGYGSKHGKVFKNYIEIYSMHWTGMDIALCHCLFLDNGQ